MKNCLLVTIALCLFSSVFGATIWNEPTPVLVGDNIYWNRCASTTADGGMIYIWSDGHRGSRDIYAQRVNAQGAQVWTNPLLLAGGPYYETNPVITKTSDNHYIIAYTVYQGGSNVKIKAQKFSANGVLIWQNDGIMVCNNEQDFYQYEIVADAAGGAYIIWKEMRANQIDIFAQRVNGSGIIQWAENGVPLGDQSGSESPFTAVSDGSGGFVILMQVNYASQSTLSLKRVNPNGWVAWNQILVTGSVYVSQTLNLTPRIDDFFIVSWHQNYTDCIKLKAQKVSLTGNIMWSSPALVVDGSTQAPQNQFPTNSKLVVSGNGVIFVWETGSLENIYAQKMDFNGNLLWNSDNVAVCTADGLQCNLRLTSDNNGGCVIAWEDDRLYNPFQRSVYVQYLDSNGLMVWPQNGILLYGNAMWSHDPLPRFLGNNVFIAWMDNRTGSYSVYYQILSPQGMHQLPVEGIALREGIDGSIVPELMVPRLNDVAVIWKDRRYGSYGERIFYQFINPDGSIQLETNGRPVTLTCDDSQMFPAAAATADGKLLIAWTDNFQIKAQLIDTDGSRLWGDDGILITQISLPFYMHSKVSYEAGFFYLFYEKLQYFPPPANTHLARIHAQKLDLNGNLLWNPDGVLISPSLDGDERFDCNLAGLNGRHVTWQRMILTPDYYGFTANYCKLVNPNGSTAAGWPAAGVALSNYLDYDSYQLNAASQLTDAGLFVVWTDYRTDFIASIYGQLVSPQGEVLWNPAGLELVPSANEQQHHYILPGSEPVVFWSEYPYQQGSIIKGQKFSAAGLPLWGESGIELMPYQEGYENSSPRAEVFTNGGIVVIWKQIANYPNLVNDGLRYCYLHQDGSLAGSSSSLGYSYFSYENRVTALLNNELYLSWTSWDLYAPVNGRCDDPYAVSSNIYAQKLSNETVSAPEEPMPVLTLSLEQNSPNPFNPHTFLSFTLKTASEAELAVYNLKGQKICTLQSGWLEKGRHTVLWNGTDDKGVPAASGVYLYRLSVPQSPAQTRKMLLLK